MQIPGSAGELHRSCLPATPGSRFEHGAGSSSHASKSPSYANFRPPGTPVEPGVRAPFPCSRPADQSRPGLQPVDRRSARDGPRPGAGRAPSTPPSSRRSKPSSTAPRWSIDWNWGGYRTLLSMCELQVDCGEEGGLGFVLLAIDTTPGLQRHPPLPGQTGEADLSRHLLRRRQPRRGMEQSGKCSRWWVTPKSCSGGCISRRRQPVAAGSEAASCAVSAATRHRSERPDAQTSGRFHDPMPRQKRATLPDFDGQLQMVARVFAAIPRLIAWFQPIGMRDPERERRAYSVAPEQVRTCLVTIVLLATGTFLAHWPLTRTRKQQPSAKGRSTNSTFRPAPVR